MPFVIRPHRRLPVQCPVSYSSGLFSGIGAVHEWLNKGVGSHSLMILWVVRAAGGSLPFRTA